MKSEDVFCVVLRRSFLEDYLWDNVNSLLNRFIATCKNCAGERDCLTHAFLGKMFGYNRQSRDFLHWSSVGSMFIEISRSLI